MKQHNAHLYLPVIEAWSGGRVIQVEDNGVWHDCLPLSDVSFRKDPTRYRIKPEPQLRPWKPEEVPMPCVFRQINDKFPIFALAVVREEGVCIGAQCSERHYVHRFVAMFEGWEYSADGGKTWHRCGVEESA
jgi:hypothetical protein